MCRCCQNCWEDFYWNCCEERFCYDESIANYNPDEDIDYVASQKNGSILGRMQPSDNNNLTVPVPICDQPMGRGNSLLMSNAKIHEEDYRRETQTNVPMLGPEILAVFANSQIFQDHQPTKLNRISTKTFLPGIHSPSKSDFDAATAKETDQERLLKRLEGNLPSEAIKSPNGPSPIDTLDASPDKHITFTVASDSSPEGSQTLTPKKFDAIEEEKADSASLESEQNSIDGVVLRPRLIDRHPHLLLHGSTSPKRTLRSVKSVPHFNVRPAASETDIFTITGTGGPISMTPEVPSISFSNLPKNYEDTPTVEKYRTSQSLYSIQTANAALAAQVDYSMPRYFRRSAMITQSNEVLSVSSMNSMSSSKEEVRRPEKEKSKRLKMLRGNLPPLLIHSVSFKKNRDEGKQVD